MRETLHRKIEKFIVNWLQNEKKALIINGARQVGKTYIIRKYPIYMLMFIRNDDIKLPKIELDDLSKL